MNAPKLAKEAGSARSVNICLLGALSNFLNTDEAIWISALTEKFQNKGLEANLEAFKLGRKSVE